MMRHTRRRSDRAFTLVELLVVIGIIAVLVGILLPTLSKARQRAQTVACMSNLRQIFQTARMYSTENNDSLPWGNIFNATNRTNGRPAAGSTIYITWFSSLDKYMAKGSTPLIPLDFNTGFFDGASTRKFSQVFRCPGIRDGFAQSIQYYNHPVAMPHIPMEWQWGADPNPTLTGGPPVGAPAKFRQLFPENALFWDTPCWSAADPHVPSMFWVTNNAPAPEVAPDTVAGFTLPAAYIDHGHLHNPKYPELRYRGPDKDRFAQSSDIYARPDGPIYWRSDEWLQANSGFAPTYNADFGGGTVYTYTIGGPRWRHNSDSACNVAFADGSVRTLRLYKGRTTKGTTVDFYDNEFRRYMLMLKWPNDKKDTGFVPPPPS